MHHHPARSWVEINARALAHNISTLRTIVGDEVILAPCVKANGYGHDSALVSEIFLEAGADWLCVDSLREAQHLRQRGITAPIYIFGYVMKDELEEVVRLSCKIMLNDREHVSLLQHYAQIHNRIIDVHLKVETGINRQGKRPEDILAFAQYVHEQSHLRIEGISTHFANIEDVKRHDFAAVQQERFDDVCTMLAKEGITIPIRHCANSAATLMYPETHYEMVRPGVICYGIWPSPLFRELYTQDADVVHDFQVAAAWKTCVAHIKHVPAGESIGYGRTFYAPSDMTIAILPVGYYDGYDRRLSNVGYVMIGGEKCQVVGRVCMNMIMVDITPIASTVSLEDEVLILGSDAHTGASIHMDEIAALQDRISYELPTRILSHTHGDIPRIRV